jgi:hypothetical protein
MPIFVMTKTGKPKNPTQNSSCQGQNARLPKWKQAIIIAQHPVWMPCIRRQYRSRHISCRNVDFSKPSVPVMNNTVMYRGVTIDGV